VYLPFSIALFFAGAMVAEFIVLKYAVRYLLAFNEWVGLEPDLRLSEWLSFAILTPLVFGLAFQLPLIMLFLYKLGIMDVEMYRKHRRIAIFVMAVITVIAAPAPDPVSFGSLLIPLWGLYELGILLCAYSPRPKYEEEEPDQQAMVEV